MVPAVATVSVPFIERRHPPHTDALNDFFLRVGELRDYIGMMSMIIRTGSATVQPGAVEERVELRQFGHMVVLPRVEVAEVPASRISAASLGWLLAKASTLQLITAYEIFLHDVAYEVLLYNDAPLIRADTKVDAAAIVGAKSLSDVRERLMEPVLFSLSTGSYPRRVKMFERLLHIGVHSDPALISLADVHHVFEFRNLIAHRDGHATEEYIERMSMYAPGELSVPVLRRYYTPPADLEWLVATTTSLLALADHIDAQARRTWTTHYPSA